MVSQTLCPAQGHLSPLLLVSRRQALCTVENSLESLPVAVVQPCASCPHLGSNPWAVCWDPRARGGHWATMCCHGSLLWPLHTSNCGELTPNLNPNGVLPRGPLSCVAAGPHQSQCPCHRGCPWMRRSEQQRVKLCGMAELV